MLIQEFDARQVHIIKIFVEEDIPFYIPIYQRRYNWTFDNEVKQLINDLRTFQEDRKEKEGITYYLGNIIVKPEVNSITDAVEQYTLIDGQQRLTTILLFIKALKDSLVTLNEKEEIEDYDKYVETLEKILFLNNGEFNGGIPSLKIDNPESNEFLYSIFSNNLNNDVDNDKLKNSNYYKNYKGFKEELKIGTFDEWKLWMETLKSVKFVRVELGKNDNEISVFESINSKGLPLNTLDLIRNYLFLVAENSKINNDEKNRINSILTNKLEPKFTNKKGIKDEKKINRFFSAHIAKETITDHEKDKIVLYKAYKGMIKPKMTFDEFKEVLDNLERDVNEYCRLLNLSINFAKNPISLDYSKSFLAESKLELYLPLFLILKERLNNNEIDQDEYNNVIEVLDMHNVLLAVADRKNSDNRFLFKYIESRKGKVDYDSLVEYITQKSNNKSRLITRDEFNEGLKKTNIYEKNSKIARYILYRIENHRRITSGEYIDFKYSLEHIFPQNDTNWKNNFENAEYKNSFLHTLGNLTLVKGKLNSKLSNQSWDKKKTTLKNNSSLRLNYELSENEEWNIINSENNNVELRVDKLSKEIQEIWPVELVDSVVVNTDSDSIDEDDQINAILSNYDKEKITIVEGIKLILFKNYLDQWLSLEEIKDGLIELYDYVEQSDYDIEITFSRDKISTGGWMTERLHNNWKDNPNKSDRHQKDIFIRNEEKEWNIAEDIHDEIEKLI